MADPILAPGPRLEPIVSPTGQPVPVTLLTGFLGAGKTTLLNRILNGDHGLRVGVLVNDFGAVNIDAGLISTVEENTISLTNGCVCCEVRDDLITSLEQLLISDREIDYVILEASGVADPEGVVMTFLEAKYEQLLRLDSITCVVDCEDLFSDRGNEALAMLKLRQIGFSDLVILNKVDLVGDDNVRQIREWIGSYLRRVRMVEADHCDVPLEILLSVGRFDPSHLDGIPDGGAHEKPTFDTWHYRASAPLRRKRLRKVVRKLPASVYRCKGFVHLADDPETKNVLQAVGRRSSITQLGTWSDDSPETEIVIIAERGSIDEIELQAAFDWCRSDS